MVWFLAGAATLFVGLYLLRGLSRANPARLASAARFLAGGAMGLAALYLIARGQAFIGGMLGLAALSVLGLSTARPFGGIFDGIFGRVRRARRSSVKSRMISMELDLDTGSMEGQVLAGPFAGAHLGLLTKTQCFDLFNLCASDDPEGARLLEPYFDRRFPGWREAREGDADARCAAPGSGGMSEKEAYETLGLAPGATRDEIAAAHRDLMKKLHPDHGGPARLAARVNEAKDVLLRRHN